MEVGQMKPVSALLEAQLRGAVRANGIVVWLDVDNHYGRFVDGLMARGGLSYEVHAWRGSHLRLMLGLESVLSGLAMRPVVIHMPGYNVETVKRTPVLEAYMAGKVFQKRLSTLVSEAAGGKVRPDDIAAYQDANKDGELESADVWLAAKLRQSNEGASERLREQGVVGIVDDLLAGQITVEGLELVAVFGRLEVLTGLSSDWREVVSDKDKLGGEDVAYAVSSWALCVEYVHDLSRAPVVEELQRMQGLPVQVIENCRVLATHLRANHAGFYQRTADNAELANLADEIRVSRAEDLGKIDTFRFEEEIVLGAALEALESGQWESAQAWTKQRLGGGSFWLEQHPGRRSAWQLVESAAALGRAIVKAGERLEWDGGFEEVVRQYSSKGVAVDQAHRHLEQRRAALLYTSIPEFETFRLCLDGMRQRWQAWADGWARDFNLLCTTRGFLPVASLQQRTFFEDKVVPLTKESGTTVVFVVDALRYEMAAELMKSLEATSSTRVTLEARFAELPTVTSVGMNVLAPVVQGGDLRPLFDGKSIRGFSAGEFQVTNPESRRRAMFDRVGGNACPLLTLEELLGRDGASLKNAVKNAKLVIVHSREIDEVGESGGGPTVFEQVLQKLRAGWRLMRDAGVRRFVFTADHGFLMLDGLAPVMQRHGRKGDPDRRHVFSAVAADHDDEVRVALSDLGYEGAEGSVIFPKTTAVFNRGNKPTSFVHGGNSLQERLVPVMTVVHRSPVGHETMRYTLAVAAAEASGATGGMHGLRATVELAHQISLSFGAAKEVELALRVPESPDVQVELVQVSGGGARIRGAAVVAPVGKEFLLLFRLIDKTGKQEGRVQVEVFHPSALADVEPARVNARYDVEVMRSGRADDLSELEVDVVSPHGEHSWLDDLPAGGVRQVFEHIAAHGTVTEDEASKMLGSPRAMRIFSIKFEEYARLVPFVIQIKTVDHVKRYVRERRG